MRSAWTLFACSILFLSGCSVKSIATQSAGSTNPAPSSPSATPIKGILHGGQQALVGAQVYLYRIGTGGYQTASTSLLSAPGYVTTQPDGSFQILSGSFSCNAGDQLYLYSSGGSPGSTNTTNSYAGLMAVLGDCANLGNLNYRVQMNEETTVAAAWALAPYAKDATDISTGSSSLAKLGLVDAVATAANLASLQTGTAPATSPQNSNATIPQDEINTLADILAACVNVTDSSYDAPNHNPTACDTLRADATADGTSGGTQPGDTATAAIYMAHNPTVHVADLLALATPTSPFQNILSSANDWTVAITYNGGSLHGPLGLAVDSSGYVWVANSGAFCVSQFQPNGATGPEDGFSGNGVEPASCGSGVSGVFPSPSYIAFSPSGNIWLANYNSLSELDFAPGLGYESYLSLVSGTSGYTGGGLGLPMGIAFDTSGNAWIPNDIGSNLSKFSGGSGTSYGGGGLSSPTGIAIDSSGHAWIPNNGANVLSEFNLSNGTPVTSTGYQYCGVSFGNAVAVAGNGIWVANGAGINTLTECNPSSGYSNAGASGSGLSYPTDIVIDGLGNVWTANSGNNTVSEFNSGGGALSGSNGFKAGLNGPNQLAIDPSGNVWVTDYNNGSGNSLTEFVGAAAPVVTPVVTAVSNSQLGQRP